MYSDLETLRDALALIPGVVSCNIGIERNISPSQYPMIRVVPVRITPGKPFNSRTIETGVYFGEKITEADGLEEVYEALFDLEKAIIDEIKDAGGRYIETVTDEDRLDTYKLMFIRCEMPSVRTAPA